MENSLTIYYPTGSWTEYRNVADFATFDNGVSIFTVGPKTVRIYGSRELEQPLPVGMKLKFKCNFTYKAFALFNSKIAYVNI